MNKNNIDDMPDELQDDLGVGESFYKPANEKLNEGFDKVYVLDTNIILEDANNLFILAENNLIILPEVVIDELDSKKSGFDEINFQAREFGRILAGATNLGIERK